MECTSFGDEARTCQRLGPLAGHIVAALVLTIASPAAALTLLQIEWEGLATGYSYCSYVGSYCIGDTTAISVPSSGSAAIDLDTVPDDPFEAFWSGSGLTITIDDPFFQSLVDFPPSYEMGSCAIACILDRTDGEIDQLRLWELLDPFDTRLTLLDYSGTLISSDLQIHPRSGLIGSWGTEGGAWVVDADWWGISGSITSASVTIVPEPSTTLLLALGLAGLAGLSRSGRWWVGGIMRSALCALTVALMATPAVASSISIGTIPGFSSTDGTMHFSDVEALVDQWTLDGDCLEGFIGTEICPLPDPLEDGDGITFSFVPFAYTTEITYTFDVMAEPGFWFESMELSYVTISNLDEVAFSELAVDGQTITNITSGPSLSREIFESLEFSTNQTFLEVSLRVIATGPGDTGNQIPYSRMLDLELRFATRPIPEPRSHVLVLVGLAIIAAAVRRSKSQQAASA